MKIPSGSVPFVLVLLTVSLSCSLLSPPAPPTVTPSPIPPMLEDYCIVFLSKNDGNWNLTRFDTVQGNDTNLLGNFNGVSPPSFSPDGGLLLFTANRDDVYNVFTFQPDSGDLFNVTDDQSVNHLPSWHPDGQRILYMTGDFGSNQIYVIHGDGSNRINLSNSSADDTSPQWSPDGSRISFLSNRAAEKRNIYDIYLMGMDGSHVIRLTNFTRKFGMSIPKWSPDGNQLAYISAAVNDNDICTINVNTGETHCVANLKDTVSNLAWSPDGKHLAYSATFNSKGITSNIYVMNADGSESTNLTEGLGSCSEFDWSLDGGNILFSCYVEDVYDSRFYSIKVDGTSLASIMEFSEIVHAPQWCE